jgi:HSP20 family protein
MRLIRYNYPSSRNLSPLGYGRSVFGGLDSEIDRLFESACTGFSAESAPASSFAVDLYQDQANTFVRAELPGVSRDQIDVEVVGAELTISASRKAATGDKEPAASSISRTVSIPEGTPADKVTAAYENGVLTVTLPKPEAAKPRKVAIQVS